VTTPDPGAASGPTGKENIEALSEQIRAEDGLFNARTGLFLTPSGILFAAYGWQRTDGPLRLGISILGLLVAVIWFLCSWQVNAALAALHTRRAELKKTEPDAQAQRKDDPDTVVQGALFGWHFLRPTVLLAWWLPWLFILTWSVPLLVALLRRLGLVAL
jgi:hypothetical protein